MDALELPQADFVGNSFGGALSLALAIRHPERVRRLVLMGSAGVNFKLTEGLDIVWGYKPSLEAMQNLLDVMAFDRSLVTNDLAKLRYEASMRTGVQESYAEMFPAPRQRWVESLASPDAQIRNITHETLVVHGREDRVLPLSNSLRLHELISNSQLHVFGRCGHWTQIEHAERFACLVEDFFVEADEQSASLPLVPA